MREACFFSNLARIRRWRTSTHSRIHVNTRSQPHAETQVHACRHTRARAHRHVRVHGCTCAAARCPQLQAEAAEAAEVAEQALTALEVDPAKLDGFDEGDDITQAAILLLNQSFAVLRQGRTVAKQADVTFGLRKQVVVAIRIGGGKLRTQAQVDL